jgi:hypothetical protein
MTFSEIVEAADSLSLDEQQSLLEILRRRIAEHGRQQLLADIEQARAEFARGQTWPASVKEIIDEAIGEP